ncbi:hypothetical protein Naga_100195g10 [Nannochloropsis gaditana]|uniref:Uncharacterized protein n=1 Tax=Nannochloropsis gaditana TaxID=72520 RepID=W7TNE5_9STRA|nr:hypothetical protein Naga_100195g10 [Nannochloropsis gaditana]
MYLSRSVWNNMNIDVNEEFSFTSLDDESLLSPATREKGRLSVPVPGQVCLLAENREAKEVNPRVEPLRRWRIEYTLQPARSSLATCWTS